MFLWSTLIGNFSFKPRTCVFVQFYEISFYFDLDHEVP